MGPINKPNIRVGISSLRPEARSRSGKALAMQEEQVSRLRLSRVRLRVQGLGFGMAKTKDKFEGVIRSRDGHARVSWGVLYPWFP